MDIFKELENLTSLIKTQRDEINVQMHLAGMEAKEELDKMETKWHDFQEKTDFIKGEGRKVADDILGNTKVIGEELQSTYHRIAERLKTRDK